MVQMLASQAAGFRLGRIVALLMLPIIWLSFLVVTDAFRELRQTAITSDGLSLMDKAFHLMLSRLSEGEPQSANFTINEQDVSLAVSVGVSKEFDLVQRLASQPDADKQDILQKTVALVTAIGNGPAAASLSDVESRALAMAASTVMPQALAAFGQIKILSSASLQAPEEADQKFPEIATQAAVLQFNARQLDNLVVRARSQTADTARYSDLLRLTSRLNFDAGYFKVLLFNKASDSHLVMGQVNGAVEEAGSKWSGTIAKGWDSLLGQLKTLNEQRRNEVSKRAYRTLGLVVLSVLFSIATAISRLDSVIT